MATKVLDVRDDLRKGVPPFGRIMAAAAGVGPGEVLVLLAPFEPAPLFGVMQQQGFDHSTSRTPEGDWEVRFTRTGGDSGENRGLEAATATPPCGCSPAASPNETASGAEIFEVDARGLQPPQPLVRILEAVATLPATGELVARTDRRPMHLYPELNARGFSALTEEESDGSFITFIRRA